jgi:hypothetical protein
MDTFKFKANKWLENTDLHGVTKSLNKQKKFG